MSLPGFNSPKIVKSVIQGIKNIYASGKNTSDKNKFYQNINYDDPLFKMPNENTLNHVQHVMMDSKLLSDVKRICEDVLNSHSEWYEKHKDSVVWYQLTPTNLDELVKEKVAFVTFIGFNISKLKLVDTEFGVIISDMQNKVLKHVNNEIGNLVRVKIDVTDSVLTTPNGTLRVLSYFTKFWPGD